MVLFASIIKGVVLHLNFRKNEMVTVLEDYPYTVSEQGGNARIFKHADLVSKIPSVMLVG